MNALQQNKFPKRLNTYNKKGQLFRIFVNEEFDEAATEMQKSLKEFANYLETLGFSRKRTLFMYTDRALKLLVVSTGNDDTSREITIGSDIKDAALGYTRRIDYGKDYNICMRLYKQYGLNCDVDDIQIRTEPIVREDRTLHPHQADIDMVLAFRKKLFQ